jgi:DUF4097 and DUF4098 domain-containing protein YvlB
MNAPMIVAAALALTASSLAAQDFRWHGALASGKTLEVRGINGDIRASRATGSEALVTATKRARKSDPDDVEIKVVEHADGVTICAVYPSRHGRRMNQCLPGGGGHNDTDDNDVEVNFEVEVPAGVEFVGTTVNGGVSGHDLPSDATLVTVNGDVDVEAGGVAHATTVNGSIRVQLGRSDWQHRLDFTTVNGGITVRLPGNTSADVEATTVNGSVESDFPITVRGKIGPGSLRGRIGEGGRELALTTVNGSIRLQKGH